MTSPENRTSYQNTVSLAASPATLFVLYIATGASAVLLNASWITEQSDKALLLAIPTILSFVLTVLHPAEGFAAWIAFISYLITQTGFQFELAGIRFSILELLLVSLLVILFLLKRRSYSIALPGQKYFNYFVLYSFFLLLIGFFQDISLTNAIPPLKGFILYPMMAYVFYVGIRTEGQVRFSMALFVFMFGLQAISGTQQFYEQNLHADELIREYELFAPLNIFAITLVSLSIFFMGFSVETTSRLARAVGFVAAIGLLIGSIFSGSRTVMVAGLFGLLALYFIERKRRFVILSGIGLLTFSVIYFLPDLLSARLFQLTDSSTFRRSFYLASGLHAWREKLILGWGWGKAFWLQQDPNSVRLADIPVYFFRKGIRLTPSATMPWYHNDYLNLAVQVGLVGLLLYLRFWYEVLRQAFGWLRNEARKQVRSPMFPYVVGAFMGLIVLLVSASFDHVLWRTDSAGMVGWMLGILVASIRLSREYQT